jgi:hypothetical protein
MFPRHLTWIFVGLFLLFGVLILLTDDDAWRRTWAGLSALALGGFALSMVRDALATGRIRLQHSLIRRASRPRLFWAAVVLVAAAGCATLGTGIWALFFKA